MGDCNTPIMGKERVAMKGTGARVGWVEFAKLAVDGKWEKYYYTRCDVQRMCDDVLAADAKGVDFELSISHRVSDSPGYANAMARIAHLRFDSIRYIPDGALKAEEALHEEMASYAGNCARQIVNVKPEYREQTRANIHRLVNEFYLPKYGLKFKAIFDEILADELRKKGIDK
jgi:hypothetical protein